MNDIDDDISNTKIATAKKMKNQSSATKPKYVSGLVDFEAASDSEVNLSIFILYKL